MPAVLCTFPGKYGDLLWALPTIRALARRLGEPVDLLIPGAFGSIAPLLARQPYLGEVITSDAWTMQDTAPISPRVPPLEALSMVYDEILHLGYRDWPLPNCAFHTRDTYNGLISSAGPITLMELDLTNPWITLPDDVPEKLAQASTYSTEWVCGFTDEYFELKYGLWVLLPRTTAVNISVGARWQSEGLSPGCTWLEGARWLAHTLVFLGDCSAWHVLAAAMGVPVLLMEPQTMRHNQVFYPLPEQLVFLIKGIDGLPTFDARHVGDSLRLRIHFARATRELT